MRLSRDDGARGVLRCSGRSGFGVLNVYGNLASPSPSLLTPSLAFLWPFRRTAMRTRRSPDEPCPSVVARPAGTERLHTQSPNTWGGGRGAERSATTARPRRVVAFPGRTEERRAINRESDDETSPRARVRVGRFERRVWQGQGGRDGGRREFEVCDSPGIRVLVPGIPGNLVVVVVVVVGAGSRRRGEILRETTPFPDGRSGKRAGCGGCGGRSPREECAHLHAPAHAHNSAAAPPLPSRQFLLHGSLSRPSCDTQGPWRIPQSRPACQRGVPGPRLTHPRHEVRAMQTFPPDGIRGFHTRPKDTSKTGAAEKKWSAGGSPPPPANQHVRSIPFSFPRGPS